MLLTLETASGDEPSAEVRAVLDAVAAEGLPTKALEIRAYEGLAKGAPEGRVIEVLQAFTGKLRRADALLPADIPKRPEAVEGAALALHAGASEAAVRRVSEAHRTDAPRALRALSDLLRIGCDEAAAVRIVQAAASSPDADHALTTVAPAAAELLSGGMDSAATADQLAQALIEGLPPSATLPDGVGAGGKPDDTPGGDRP